MKSLKHLALATLVVAGLLLLLVAARPRPATAGFTADVCQLGGNIYVTGTAKQHSYKYDLSCLFQSVGQTVHVTGTYDYTTGSAIEELYTDDYLYSNDSRIKATWACEDDPWSAANPPACSLTALPVSTLDVSPFDLSQRVGPFSTQFLNSSDHHVLAAQLQNALNQPAALAPTPLPRLERSATTATISCPNCAVLAAAATSAPAPTQPDFKVPNVGGDKNLAQGSSSVYSFAVSSMGTKPATQVQISIQVTGAVQYVAMTQTPAGWDCSGTGPILCVGPLGGYGDPVQSLVAGFQMQVRGVKAGVGSITVMADPNGLIQESDETNNANQIVITVK